MTQQTTPNFAPDGMAGGPAFDSERFRGIKRDYTDADVARLSGSFRVQHTLADKGARRLWQLLKTEPFVNTLGALTGNQAVQQVKAGLKAIYLSGWQVAADANTAGQMYPDQSLYPVDSVPNVVKRINSALRRCDQIATMEGDNSQQWMAPIVADAEAGFGGALNAYELMRAMIEAGAAGVHFEDQLASEKKCGHLGGKVLVPISQHIRTLNAARLAADVEGVPTVLLCRTDSQAAQLLTAIRADRRYDESLFLSEAEKNNVFPIGAGLWTRLHPEDRIKVPYTHWDFDATTTRLPEFAGPGLGRESNRVVVDLDVDANASGVIYALAGVVAVGCGGPGCAACARPRAIHPLDR